MAADTLCKTPFGEFRLHRYPTRRDEPLRAWCAADLLILEELHRIGLPPTQTLVVNDEHGALSAALQAMAMWTDSAMSALALQHNLALNERPDVPVVWSTALPAVPPGIVALRVPKQLSFLAYQLAVLAPTLGPGTQVLAAGMDKHLSPQVAEILEQTIGPTQRHPGKRKARLFSATRDERHCAPPATDTSYYCDAVAAELRAYPNVFSRNRLDGGSRLLLAQLESLAPASSVLDLACGNGVLGLTAYKQRIAPRVIFADESAMAMASTRQNADRLFPQDGGAFTFHQDDGLVNFAGPAIELILCNPPFHLNHTVDEYAGRRLLQQCARQLQAGGRLCLVANRHLDYRPTLKRYFQKVEKLASDRRFDVWLASSG